MNIKNLPITIVLLVVSLLVVGCGPGSEQSTPTPTTIDLSLLSKDLAGHWGSFPEGQDEPVLDVYFGEVLEKGIGYGFWRGVDQSYDFSYRIFSGDGGNLTLEMAEKGASWGWEAFIQIAEDGLSMTYFDTDLEELQYIDSKTEP